MSGLPDAEWCSAVSDKLNGNDDWKGAVDKIGDPLFLKVKADDDSSSVLLAVGDGADTAAVSVHTGDKVEGDVIVVSMKHEVWDRVLRGSTDLMNAFMGREMKANASMFKLMKITDPAERLIEQMRAAQPGA